VPRPGYAPQLDGLRALAVAAVAWSHWLPQWQFGLPLGAGVHLFFVLSGFLITRILLGLRGETQRGAAVGRFLMRRALRLVPAFYLVLGLAAWADVPLVRDTWAWHAGYLSNVYIAGEHRWLGHVSHFWSLAVEQQFYLVWPWLIVFAPARWLGHGVVGLVLVGPASRLAAWSLGLTEPFWALVPGGSADSLGVGALLAWSHVRGRDGMDGASVPWGRIAAGAAVGWVLLRGAETAWDFAPAGLTVWRQVLQAFVFAWLVHRVATGDAGSISRPLAHQTVRYVGRVSYGAYLVHAFAPGLLSAGLRAAGAEALMPEGAPVRALAYAATTLVAAAVMWHLVEAPFNALKARVPQRS
jgi:peptidoglycan/LPS O-acetylase OafA/YrhL